jgi:D-3-phosphoglycerate dehydrogenase
MAKERGITVTESTVSESSDFTNLLRLTVEGEAGKHTLAGTVVGKSDPRIVEIDGYRMDILPQGNLILFFNRDTPGIMGKVGGILGDAKINIAGLTNGRKAKGGDAVSVFQVDEDVPETVLAKIAALEGLKDVRVIKL